MKRICKPQYFIYAVAFAVAGLTITSTVYMAGNTAPRELDVPDQAVQNMTDVHYLHVSDVDPMSPDTPAYSRVGNTLKAEWALENVSEEAVTKLSYSLDNGTTWTDVLNETSKESYTLLQVPETDADSMLFRVEAEGESLTSEVTIHKEPVAEEIVKQSNKRNR